ncbi:MAG: molecular chaperone DnaJ [Clostridia bacterium]|nr:molecular chaperone DnaJ [Clostridia bacterium]
MAEKYDYYEILGVSKNATDDEIKSAYRRMAKKYHPDLYTTRPEDERRQAEEQFKKINHAYDVLSDKQKRAAYDQYGDENGPMGGGFGGADGAQGFSGFDDFFGDFFSAFTGGRRGTRASGRINGDDITVNITIDFMEAVRGVQKDINITRQESCADCRGTGAKGGSAYKTCTRCGGSGHITTRQNTIFGQQVIQSICPDCRGTGKIITETCRSCGGKGAVRQSRVIHANIPAGIDNGQMITFYNEGNCGKNGGSNGNLILIVNVRPHPLFKRKGYDVYFDVPISFSTAALGGEIEVPTLDGVTKYKVAEGTATGTVCRLSGKGIKRVYGSTKGDLYFTLQVQTPSGLSKQQKEMLKNFEDSLSPSQCAKQKKFSEFLKK